MLLTPRNGLLLWCGLSMLAFTSFQRLELWPALLAAALFSGALVGWLVGSGEWRAMGKDLIGAIVVLVCLLFGATLPIVSIVKMVEVICIFAALAGLPLGYWTANRTKRFTVQRAG